MDGQIGRRDSGAERGLASAMVFKTILIERGQGVEKSHIADDTNMLGTLNDKKWV